VDAVEGPMEGVVVLLPRGGRRFVGQTGSVWGTSAFHSLNQCMSLEVVRQAL
jgi:hypothetical protein